jgi:hypothetical protein
MGNARTSIGVDNATGEPANAPEGPYITEVDDARERPRRDREDPAPSKQPQSDGPAKPLSDRRKGPAQP